MMKVVTSGELLCKYNHNRRIVAKDIIQLTKISGGWTKEMDNSVIISGDRLRYGNVDQN